MRGMQLSLRARGVALGVAFALVIQGAMMPWILVYAMLPYALDRPDPVRGITAPFNNHGTTVYITPWESWFVQEALIGMFVGFAIFILVAVTQKPITR